MLQKIGPRAYEKVAGRLPPRVSAAVDLIRPSLRESWGGPLNGQEQRRAIVRSLGRMIDFAVVIETGTFRGTSTEFFSAVFGLPIITVESNPRFYAYSRRRLAVDPKISVRFGDSRQLLRELAKGRPSDAVFVYLDAHWEEDLPLREELGIIREAWATAVVMVDDFAVPRDPGYQYDDYGPGKALTEDYLPPMAGWTISYPDAPSSQETGARRGSAVLFSPSLAGIPVPGLTAGRSLT